MTTRRRARYVRATVVLTACAALLLSRPTGSVAGSFGLNHDWVSIHGDLANNRYVPLGQINLKTIGKLGAVWVSEPFADGATSRMTPIVHDSLMLFAADARVYALDARSGSVRWVHKTESRRLVNSRASAIRSLRRHRGAGGGARPRRSPKFLHLWPLEIPPPLN